VKKLDTSQYLSLFLEESAENIENLNQLMLELEKEPENGELLSEIFRGAHTLKGMAATMGFKNIAELTHSMENVLDKLRNKTMDVSSELITVLFECMDTLERMIGDVTNGGSDGADCSEIMNKLNNILNNKQPEIKKGTDAELRLNVYDIDVLKEAQKRLFNAYEISVDLRKDCQMKSARAFLVFNNLQQYGEITKSVPSAEDIEKEQIGDTIRLIYISQRENDFIKNVIESISEIDKVSVENVDFEKLQKPEPVSPAQKAPEDKGQKEAPAHTQKISQSVRVDLDRLDKLMNLVGELVIHRTRLEEISASNHLAELNETLEQVGRITSDLQDLVMKVRMMPLDRVFSRLPRMVRDLSTELNKDINFTIKGQETELDRTVIDELGDSIIHLLRNAVDHGVETREERLEAGKNPVGNVTVTAYQEGNKAVIKVEDDGKGLDINRIKQKAIQKGIDIGGMSDKDIVNLIFLEGFSTSDKVTDVSGRGVGMDVVRTKVNSIGGSIDIKTKKNEGTTFTIHLPLTLSIIQALLVNSGKQTFAISLGFIEKVISVDKNTIKYSNNREVAVYMGDVIPVIRLSERLGVHAENPDKGFLVIVKVGDKCAGLIVDSLVGQQEIVIKPLGKSLKNVKGYTGATILGNGRVTLILDVVSIITER
jgi:Chemotaxis protein histidine kinase and related kinases